MAATVKGFLGVTAGEIVSGSVQIICPTDLLKYYMEPAVAAIAQKVEKDLLSLYEGWPRPRRRPQRTRPRNYRARSRR